MKLALGVASIAVAVSSIGGASAQTMSIRGSSKIATKLMQDARQLQQYNYYNYNGQYGGGRYGYGGGQYGYGGGQNGYGGGQYGYGGGQNGYGGGQNGYGGGQYVNRNYYGQQQGGGDNENFFLYDYSIKLLACIAGEPSYSAEGGNQVQSSTVVFRLCPASSCNDSNLGCEEGYGDYTVGINTFVGAYVESQRENDNSGLTSYNMYGQEFKAEEYSECKEYDREANNNREGGNQNYNYQGYYYDNSDVFIGPTCTADGKGIRLGLFYDQYCSFQANTEFKNIAYGWDSLPFESGGLIPDACMSCVSYNNGNWELSEMCQKSYKASSARCESNMQSNMYGYYGGNNNGCTYIDNLVSAVEFTTASQKMQFNTTSFHSLRFNEEMEIEAFIFVVMAVIGALLMCCIAQCIRCKKSQKEWKVNGIVYEGRQPVLEVPDGPEMTQRVSTAVNLIKSASSKVTEATKAALATSMLVAAETAAKTVEAVKHYSQSNISEAKENETVDETSHDIDGNAPKTEYSSFEHAICGESDPTVKSTKKTPRSIFNRMKGGAMEDKTVDETSPAAKSAEYSCYKLPATGKSGLPVKGTKAVASEDSIFKFSSGWMKAATKATKDNSVVKTENSSFKLPRTGKSGPTVKNTKSVTSKDRTKKTPLSISKFASSWTKAVTQMAVATPKMKGDKAVEEKSHDIEGTAAKFEYSSFDCATAGKSGPPVKSTQPDTSEDSIMKTPLSILESAGSGMNGATEAKEDKTVEEKSHDIEGTAAKTEYSSFDCATAGKSGPPVKSTKSDTSENSIKKTPVSILDAASSGMNGATEAKEDKIVEETSRDIEGTAAKTEDSSFECATTGKSSQSVNSSKSVTSEDSIKKTPVSIFESGVKERETEVAVVTTKLTDVDPIFVDESSFERVTTGKSGQSGATPSSNRSVTSEHSIKKAPLVITGSYHAPSPTPVVVPGPEMKTGVLVPLNKNDGGLVSGDKGASKPGEAEPSGVMVSTTPASDDTKADAVSASETLSEASPPVVVTAEDAGAKPEGESKAAMWGWLGL